ncbi:UDP-glucose 4-epimerase family protein [Pandoraea vervacti]|nr:SDR family oxidoreductase [Pandoraea vervacti]
MVETTAAKIMTTNILVTGASGLVGGALLSHLSALRDVRAFGAYRTKQTNDEFSRVAGDLGADTDWSAALSGIDVVVHCAARVHVMNEAGNDVALAKFRDVNVAGTARLARECLRAGVRRLVFVSSVKVNGESTTARAPYRYDDPPAPQDPYGVSKWEAEEALWEIARDGLEVVVVRPPLVYGPGVKANFLRLMQAVANGRPLPFGAVRNGRSMVYVGNLVDLLSTCATHPAAAGQTFLVSDGADLSTGDLVGAIAAALGSRPRLLRVPPWLMECAAGLIGKKATADRVLGSLQVDIAHTCDTLGWRPPFSVQEGMRATVSAWRSRDAIAS